MPGPVLSERDLAVLRSFARRIDPSDAGAHNNLGRPLLPEGADRGRDRRVRPRAASSTRGCRWRRATSTSPTARAGTTTAGSPSCASGSAGSRRTATRAGSWAARTRPSAATPRRSPSSRRCSPGSPADVPAMLQLGLAEKARGNLDTATDWLARACAQDPASAVARFYLGEVLYNRGLNEPALARAARGDRAQPRLRRSALPPRLRLRRHGPARGSPRGHQAGHQAQPDAGAGAGQPRARALRRRTAPAPPARRGAVERPQIVEGGALAHYNLGLAFRQKGTARGGARASIASRSMPARTARLTLQAMAEVHLLRRELAAALELYDVLVREYPDSPKLWNERGVCLHQAGRRAEAIASYERAVRADADYQLAWNNLGVVHAGDGGRRRDRRLPARARGGAAAVRGAAQPGPAVPAAAPAPRGARGVPAARWSSRAGARSPGTASGSC